MLRTLLTKLTIGCHRASLPCPSTQTRNPKMSLVFYYAPWSTATTCHWALEELGVPHEKVKLDLSKKETQTPEFLALNPNGKVPLLVHDGVPIYESIAILAHLGETFGVE